MVPPMYLAESDVPQLNRMITIYSDSIWERLAKFFPLLSIVMHWLGFKKSLKIMIIVSYNIFFISKENARIAHKKNPKLEDP